MPWRAPHCCRAPRTPQALEGAVWSGLPRSQNVTVESMMQGCSFGMGSITMADGGHLLRVPVPIPCNGTTPDGTLYNSLECPFPGEGAPSTTAATQRMRRTQAGFRALGKRVFNSTPARPAMQLGTPKGTILC